MQQDWLLVSPQPLEGGFALARGGHHCKRKTPVGCRGACAPFNIGLTRIGDAQVICYRTMAINPIDRDARAVI